MDAADPTSFSNKIWPTAGWQTSTPEEQGTDSVALARLVAAVGARRQDSLLVIRHGRIVAEAYYAPFEAGIRHDLRSVTKSVMGTLVGIAVQNGFLNSADERIVDLFSPQPIANLDDRKREMTVQNLLDMASGIRWTEAHFTSDESIMQMYRDGIINVQRIPDVLKEWDQPSFDEFTEKRSAWRLFNAATYALNGRVVENGHVTPKLHKVIDGVCERIN